MTRISDNLRYFSATLAVGCVLLAAGAPAQAQFPRGSASRNPGGFLKTPAAMPRMDSGRALNFGHRPAGPVGPRLGNPTPIKPASPAFRPPTHWGGGQMQTSLKPTFAGNRGPTMNEGGRALINRPGPTANPFVKTMDRDSRRPGFQQPVGNPRPPAAGSSPIRTDLRNTRPATGPGGSIAGTNNSSGGSKLVRPTRPTRPDAGRIANQGRRTITNNGTLRPPKPSTGNSGHVGKHDATADTLNGIANLVGAIAAATPSAELTENVAECVDCFPEQINVVDGVQSMVLPPQPIFTTPVVAEPAVQPVVAQPTGQPVVIYNSLNAPQSFTVDVSGQAETTTLQPGEAVEISLSRFEVSFSDGRSARRYTLFSGKAYKFSAGSDGQLNLFSFDPATLSAP